MKTSSRPLCSTSRAGLPLPARSLFSCLLLAISISLPSPALSAGNNWLDWGSWGLERDYLVAVWGSSASDIFAVGRGGAILHYDGETWKGMSTGTIDYTSVELRLEDVWGTGPDDVYALGCFHEGIGGCLQDTIVHYDGRSWKSVLLSEPYALDHIWGSSSNDVYVVGGDRMWHYDGNIWSHVDLGTAESWNNGPLESR